MRPLIQCLEYLQSKLDRFRKLGIKETSTRTVFIDPTLEALGWDVRDPDDVELEYATVAGRFVDYALKLNRRPVLFVEAKALSDPLTDPKAIAQVIGYAANAGVVWCILTNGVQWKVYRSVEKCEAPDKLMFEVSLNPHDNEGVEMPQVAQQMWRFSREEMAKGTLDAVGEQTFTDGKIRRALDQLMRTPPRKLLNLVRDAVGDKDLKPRQIKDSLMRICSGVGPDTAEFSTGSGGPPVRDATALSATRSQAAVKSWQTRRSKKRGTYDEQHHTSGVPREVVELYQTTDRLCLGMAATRQITKRYMARYIVYAFGKNAFCWVTLRQSGLRISLPLKYSRIQDPPPFARDVSKIRGRGRREVLLAISSQDQLKAASRLIRSSFDSTVER